MGSSAIDSSTVRIHLKTWRRREGMMTGCDGDNGVYVVIYAYV